MLLRAMSSNYQEIVSRFFDIFVEILIFVKLSSEGLQLIATLLLRHFLIIISKKKNLISWLIAKYREISSMAKSWELVTNIQIERSIKIHIIAHFS